MVSATAPGAQIVLVSDVDTATTNGLTTAILYVVNNAVAPILTMSYGECELKLGTAGNTLYNQIFQQAATAGISAFVAAGDSGSAACTPQNGINPPYSDPFGLAVNGMASSPYVTAVGGTDLQWPFVEATKPISTYWNATNDVHGATAKGYMPEMSWNGTCSNPILLNVYTSYANTEALCNAANLALPGLVQMGFWRRRSEQLHGQQLHSHQHNLVPHELFRRTRETHLASGSCRNSRRRQAGLAGCFPVWLLRICLKHRDSRQCIVDLPGVRLTAEFLRLHAPGLHHLPGERWHLCRVANGRGSHGTGAAKGR
jgi:hypothetical protein